jgi:hypothetical protein
LPLRLPPPTPRRAWDANAAKQRIETVVGTCNAMARGLEALKVELAAEVADTDEIKDWCAAFVDAIGALRKLHARAKDVMPPEAAQTTLDASEGAHPG